MAGELHEGTAVPGEEHAAEGGMPQMNPEWFASQLFWLVLTFGFLLIVMSRIALPSIGGVIEARRSRITGDLEGAEQARKDAAGALKAYESSMAGARSRALALADEGRKAVVVEVDRVKAATEASAQKTMAEAEARIGQTRAAAAANVRAVASEAAADIVERLIGERVSPADAARAVEASRGSR
jgi:F-type H+-transporting ATPase subunit b